MLTKIMVKETSECTVQTCNSLNLFNTIFRQETSTALQGKSQKRISRVFTFCWQKYFLHVADDQTFSVVISKVQNKQGILLFVHWKLV